MSACPSHHIDARSSAEHLAHTYRHGTSFEVWIGLSHKFPIALAPEVFKPASRFCHAWHIDGAACFEQENANVWILCQVARHHRASRPLPSSHELVIRFYTRPPPPL